MQKDRVGKLTSRDAAVLVSKIAGIDVTPDDMTRYGRKLKNIPKVGRHYKWTTKHCKEVAELVKSEEIKKKIKRA